MLWQVVLDMPKDAPLPPFTAVHAVPSLLHHRQDPTQAAEENSIKDLPAGGHSIPSDGEATHSEDESQSGRDSLEQQPDAPGSDLLDNIQHPDEASNSLSEEAATDRPQGSDIPETTPTAFPNTAEMLDIGCDTGGQIDLAFPAGHAISKHWRCSQLRRQKAQGSPKTDVHDKKR